MACLIELALSEEAGLSSRFLRQNQRKETMKKNLMTALLLSAWSLALPATVFADDQARTITGDGQCAKCVLKENRLLPEHHHLDQDGKKVTYYLTHNKVSKELGNQLCTESKRSKPPARSRTWMAKWNSRPRKLNW